jgi:hypothetical protein
VRYVPVLMMERRNRYERLRVKPSILDGSSRAGQNIAVRLKSIDTEGGVFRRWSTVGTRNVEFRGNLPGNRPVVMYSEFWCS